MNKHLMIKRCRRLRKEQTSCEKELWQQIRNRKIRNLKFLRQHPIIYQTNGFDIYYFIADFYCAEKRIIIELDGKIHEFQKTYDENRDKILKSLNITVVRFKNSEIKKVSN